MTSNLYCGVFYRQACEAVLEGYSYDLSLHNGQKEMDPKWFYEALCKGIQARTVSVGQKHMAKLPTFNVWGK